MKLIVFAKTKNKIEFLIKFNKLENVDFGSTSISKMENFVGRFSTLVVPVFL